MTNNQHSAISPGSTQSDDEHHYCDVLIVGSGSAGLVTALRCASAGLATTVLERAELVGGTTALSAAAIWVPANDHAAAAGLTDSKASALQYIRAAAPEEWAQTEDRLWARFVNDAADMLRFIESNSPLRFALTGQSDGRLDLPGASVGARMVSPMPLRRSLAGSLSKRLRPPPLPHLFTYQEALRSDAMRRPWRAALSMPHTLAWRAVTGRRTMGTALVIGLLNGCHEKGCRIETSREAVAPIMDGEKVVGLRVRTPKGLSSYYARLGVVLASGGFEWNRTLLNEHFPGPIDFLASPKENDGAAHRIAVQAGGVLAHMDQANITAGMPVSGALRPFGLSMFFQRESNAIIVNRHGHRFTNEADINVGVELDRRNPASGEPLHLPAWLISDSRFLARQSLVKRAAARNPGWLVASNTICELAQRIGLPGNLLEQTIQRFNAGVSGMADEFGRQGDLAPVEAPPYIAIPFNRTIVSTKGGPRTDEYGRVLRADGHIVEGLYCAGVAMANPIGSWALGPGTTLGPNMTWGYICANALIECGRGRKES